MEFLVNNFVPLMFCGLIFFLLTGFPVAFSLAATGLGFGWLANEIGLFPLSLFQALPLRLFGIMSNDTLLAIPFFTFMGIVLQRSGMAEDLLETIGQVFGRVRGGLAIAVILVGALLAATTGVVSAAVISMGLISLPIMLRYGYNRSIATGVISASGTLAQVVPPSLVLIVMADQLGRPVGDMYAGALIPALLLILLYAVFIIGLAVFRANWVTALPPEALIYKEDDGASGHKSLLVVLGIAGAAGYVWSLVHEPFMSVISGTDHVAEPAGLVISSMVIGAVVALAIAITNRLMRAQLLSKLTEQVVFVLIPPLVLVFLVLGTIFLGIATPTEGGAMGATGALVMALARRSLGWKLLRQALDHTALLTIFVMFIVIGATIFSFTFNAVDGIQVVGKLFDSLPGGYVGFLIAVNLLVFVLGMFIDYFEIAFIVIPILAPVAEQMGIDLVWFGVMLAMNLQTSFLTPPFGYALFYLRSVAPKTDYTDLVTKRRIGKVTTGQIYKGSLVFILLQVVMLVMVIVFPELVTNNLDRAPTGDLNSIELNVDRSGYEAPAMDMMDGFEVPKPG
ncbi:C4-dicarboxylate ABC transporter [Pollutimonas subterranea]|uniref:C4-dicarboxylate ABC transporter n=1 Tax=Pollutimonas subterranea TaxID=2045210 RepID=A0A2N4U6V2_9BURK|nr:TRAP transporter large permease subunit [Pollutimonas subterranea]PLC50729.1 C4-dicarboxylate ABC transporter [Pollutimonas subterranea]